MSPLPFSIIPKLYFYAYPCIWVLFSKVSSILCYLLYSSILRKCLYSFFQLYSNCICKPIIVSVKITTKIFKFYCFPMYFHYFIRYMLCKLLQIYQKNISTSFLNYIIILFVCLPFYLWKLAQNSSIINICTWISII